MVPVRRGAVRPLHAVHQALTGPAQAVLAALALLTDAVPGWVGFALLISAAAVEVMAPFRRGTALRLDEAIQESRQAR